MNDSMNEAPSTHTVMTTRRQFLQAAPAAAAAFTVAGHILLDDAPALVKGASPPKGHFHPKGKPPSKHTLKVLADVRKTLPFGDRRDFEEQEKGFIAPMTELKIQADAGHVAWDMERYQFFTGGR